MRRQSRVHRPMSIDFTEFQKTFSNLSCQNNIIELYSEMQKNFPFLLESFEEVLLDFVKEMQNQQLEQQALEQTFKKEKESHLRHVETIEEEVDTQMTRLEESLQEKIRRQLEQKYLNEIRRKEDEISSMTKKLEDLETSNEQQKELKVTNQRANAITDEEKEDEIRNLKSQLESLECKLAESRTDIKILHKDLNEKSIDLDSNKQTLLQMMLEKDNCSMQMRQLKMANQKLHDTNDDLRSALENLSLTKSEAGSSVQDQSDGLREYKRHTNTGTSVLLPCQQEHLDSGHFTNEIESEQSQRRSEFAKQHHSKLRQIKSYLDDQVKLRTESVTSADWTDERTDIDEDELMSANLNSPTFDNAQSETILTGQTVMSGVEATASGVVPSCTNASSRLSYASSRQTPLQSVAAHSLNSTATTLVCSSSPFSRNQQQVLSAENMFKQSGTSDVKFVERSTINHVQSGQSNRRSSMQPPRILEAEHSLSIEDSIAPGNLIKDSNADCCIIESATENKIPERIFKIVLLGDASVGKSSFMMRFTRGTFSSNVSATVGVDFQTKIIDVDGRVFAIQVWDTAGQERYRSIIKTYFRKADGIILMYDCTNSSSFMSIREWIDIVQENSMYEYIPMMLMANKIDLRVQLNRQGIKCVNEMDGKKMAKNYQILFSECSVKDQFNVDNAVVELARLLRAKEDLEVSKIQLSASAFKTAKRQNCCIKF